MIQSAELLTGLALLPYSLATLVYALMWWKSAPALRWLAPSLVGMGLLVNLYQLIARWVIVDQPPFKTLYESLVLLAICVAVLYLAVELVWRARILGLPAAASCALILLYAFLRHDKEAVNLPPALQSGWFIPHVVVYFFGYAALVLSAGAALLYLLRPRPIELARPDLIVGGALDLEKLLDTSVRFGFVLLTLGLIVGAVWAKQAWGDYWGFDPKETWALVTWLLFAAYLHLHYFSEWRGRRLAILVLVGFAAVAFTYLGMHLLPTAEQSVHVYQ